MENIVGPLLLALMVTGILAGIVRLIAHHREVENQRDDARRRDTENMTFLTDFTKKLGAVEEVQEALQLVAHHLADECDAESLAIFVDRNTDGKKPYLKGGAVAGPFPTFRPAPAVVQRRPQYRLQHLLHEVFRYGETAIGIVAQRRQSILVEHYDEAPPELALPQGVHTFMAVPMIVEDNFLGVVCAANRRTVGKGFTLDHLSRLELLSCQAALACSLVRIYADRSDQQRLHQEMDFVRDLQQRLLPANVPNVDGCLFAAVTEPAREVGGDYYDFIQVDEHRTMVVVADAAGKGVSACMLMAMCRAFVRCMVESRSGLETFLADLNRRLYADTASHHFVTMAVVVIDSRDRVCELACAGHAPFIMRMADGRCVSVRPDGPALGMLPDEFGIGFETLSFRIHSGAQLLIHTDGITEACNEAEEEFEFERLFQVWEQNPLPAEKFLPVLREQVQSFVGQAEQYDDQTLVAIDFVDPVEDEAKETAHVGQPT
jgi:serine phosphatase RsbU (regulator of sigma subunit)